MSFGVRPHVSVASSVISLSQPVCPLPRDRACCAGLRREESRSDRTLRQALELVRRRRHDGRAPCPLPPAAHDQCTYGMYVAWVLPRDLATCLTPRASLAEARSIAAHSHVKLHMYPALRLFPPDHVDKDVVTWDAFWSNSREWNFLWRYMAIAVRIVPTSRSLFRSAPHPLRCRARTAERPRFGCSRRRYWRALRLPCRLSCSARSAAPPSPKSSRPCRRAAPRAQWPSIPPPVACRSRDRPCAERIQPCQS